MLVTKTKMKNEITYGKHRSHGGILFLAFVGDHTNNCCIVLRRQNFPLLCWPNYTLNHWTLAKHTTVPSVPRILWHYMSQPSHNWPLLAPTKCQELLSSYAKLAWNAKSCLPLLHDAAEYYVSHAWHVEVFIPELLFACHHRAMFPSVEETTLRKHCSCKAL